MRRRDEAGRLASSVLDRLLDPSGQQRTGSPASSGQELRHLKLNVARDLENLLNTRRRCKEPPAGCRELSGSLLDYGIPDFTGLNMSVPVERERTRLEIERVIRRFEPRLKNVAVTVQTNVDSHDRTLRLRITGVLRTEPVAERVVFDSEIEPSTAAIEIKALP